MVSANEPTEISRTRMPLVYRHGVRKPQPPVSAVDRDVTEGNDATLAPSSVLAALPLVGSRV